MKNVAKSFLQICTGIGIIILSGSMVIRITKTAYANPNTQSIINDSNYSFGEPINISGFKWLVYVGDQKSGSLVKTYIIDEKGSWESTGFVEKLNP